MSGNGSWPQIGAVELYARIRSILGSGGDGTIPVRSGEVGIAFLQACDAVRTSFDGCENGLERFREASRELVASVHALLDFEAVNATTVDIVQATHDAVRELLAAPAVVERSKRSIREERRWVPDRAFPLAA